MRITAIEDAVVPIKSSLRNAFINFSEMTISVVRITTDVIRDRKPVVGYGFNSNGRYAQSGILRDRMIPRLLNTGSNPHVFQPFGGFGDHARITDGRVSPPDIPSIGFEVKSDLMRVFDGAW